MAEHGTTARYMAHRRAKEQACIECKAAWRTWQQDRRKEAMKRDSTPVQRRP